MRTTKVATLLVAGLLAAAMAQAPKSRDDAWREDLSFLAREFPTRQLDFAKLYPKEKFDKDFNSIKNAIPTASDAELVLSLMRLVASAHVGHTYLRSPTTGPLAFHRLPLGVQWFADGLAVTAAAEPYRDALGLRVEKIGTLTPEQLEAAVAPYIAYENDEWLHQQSQSFMLIEEILRAVKAIDSDGRVAITLARADGTQKTVRVMAAAPQDLTPLVYAVTAFGIPIGPAHVEPQRHYRYEILPSTKTLYVRYNKCADDPQQPFAAFAKDLFASIDANPAAIDRVVIDLRANGGGDSRVITPLIDGLRARKSLSARGRLYALIGPGTFSSGLLAAVVLRNDLKAVMIGERSGENLNSYGEVRPLTLPNSRLLLQYSTKYFKLLKHADSFDPDIVVRTSIADWLTGRDRVLDYAVSRRPG